MKRFPLELAFVVVPVTRLSLAVTRRLCDLSLWLKEQRL